MNCKILLIAILLLQNNPIPVNGKCFRGYIFSADHFVLLTTLEAQNNRFTPTKEDVFEAEEILNRDLKSINSSLLNQGKDCPIIHKKLKKYVRQYVGYKNSLGQKNIWMNLNWEKYTTEEGLKLGVSETLGGCSYSWSVCVNLDTKSLFDLNVSSR